MSFLIVLPVLLYFFLSVVVLEMALVPKRRPAIRTPADAGMVAEPLQLESAEDHIPLRGWFLRGRGERAVVVLHGLDGSGWNNHSEALAGRLLERGFTVLTLDFRGQGSSGDATLGMGWLERRDVRAAVDLLLERGFAPGRIGLNGSSYGAATALLSAAAMPEVGAVVADSAFADVRDLMGAELKRRVLVGRVFLTGIELVGRWRHGLDLAEIPPERAVPQIAPRPIFFLHGEQDARIPVAHAHRLKAASKNPMDTLWIVPGAEHTQAHRLYPEEYFNRVVGFFEARLP